MILVEYALDLVGVAHELRHHVAQILVALPQQLGVDGPALVGEMTDDLAGESIEQLPDDGIAAQLRMLDEHREHRMQLLDLLVLLL